MSPLMISRLLKPSVFKNALRHKNARLFSYTPTYPFLLIDYLVNNPNSVDHRPVSLKSRYEDPNCSKQKQVLIYEKKLRDEVMDAMTSILPYHIFLEKTRDDDNSLRIIIQNNPSTLKSPAFFRFSVPDDFRVSLPPLPSGSKVENIAMSSLPYKQDKDWVVGVKLAGSRLSFCRPFGDSKWIDVKAMPESINPFSNLMFSHKDEKFYIPSTGGNKLCSFDLRFREEDEPQFTYSKHTSEDLGLSSGNCFCSRTNHLVEVPFGRQILLVQWYGDDSSEAYNCNGTKILMHKTKHFKVFRAKETWYEDISMKNMVKNMVYTEDIGDYCIFLGYSESFCVSTKLSPGLKPNCIYFMGYSFGVYDLTTKTCTTFYEEKKYEDDNIQLPLRNLKFPFCPPPSPLY